MKIINICVKHCKPKTFPWHPHYALPEWESDYPKCGDCTKEDRALLKLKRNDPNYKPPSWLNKIKKYIKSAYL